MGSEFTFCVARQRKRPDYKTKWLQKLSFVLNHHDQYPVVVMINDPNWGFKSTKSYTSYVDIEYDVNEVVNNMFNDYEFDV